MESSSTAKRLTFGDLKSRLLRTLRLKVDNGEFTERGLARVSGISQPQVHNLLKGARRLSSESADILLNAVQLSVVDLLTESELSSGDLPAAPPTVLVPKPVLPAASVQQLPLVLEPEGCPRKNPASALPSLFEINEQAS